MTSSVLVTSNLCDSVKLVVSQVEQGASRTSSLVISAAVSLPVMACRAPRQKLYYIMERENVNI